MLVNILLYEAWKKSITGCSNAEKLFHALQSPSFGQLSLHLLPREVWFSSLGEYILCVEIPIDWILKVETEKQIWNQH